MTTKRLVRHQELDLYRARVSCWKRRSTTNPFHRLKLDSQQKSSKHPNKSHVFHHVFQMFPTFSTLLFQTFTYFPNLSPIFPRTLPWHRLRPATSVPPPPGVPTGRPAVGDSGRQSPHFGALSSAPSVSSGIFRENPVEKDRKSFGISWCYSHG